MTTNVRDSQSGFLASDSRWTWQVPLPSGGIHKAFLDDTGYEKIVRAKGCVFMFAGNALVIEAWKHPIKQWSYTHTAPDWNTLETTGMALSVVQESTGSVLYEVNHEIRLGDMVSFAGTGSYGAAECWQLNQCAKKAVESAKLTDPHTGGTVRFHNVRTGDTNVGADIDLDALISKFIGGGTMTGDKNNTSALGEVGARHESAANDDVEIRQAFVEAYAKGQAPTAPCDGVFAVWPAEEKAKLVKVMERIFAV